MNATNKTAPRIIATRGLPGSGKTSWAMGFLRDNPKWGKRVNNDDLRLMLDGVVFDKDNEPFIRTARKALIGAALAARQNVLIDNCNLSPAAEREVENFAKTFGATLEWKAFTHVPMEVCIERDSKRPDPVGREVITAMARRFMGTVPSVPAATAYQYDLTLPEAVICDVDGTLALNHGHRGVYDFTSAHLDRLNEPVRAAFRALTTGGCVPIVFTAREEKYRSLTLDWLHAHGIFPQHVFMRQTGDRRPDDIVKRKMFEEHIRGKYNVLAIFDDRDRVVRMWRDMGLTCFQVADGNF